MKNSSNGLKPIRQCSNFSKSPSTWIYGVKPNFVTFFTGKLESVDNKCTKYLCKTRSLTLAQGGDLSPTKCDVGLFGPFDNIASCKVDMKVDARAKIPLRCYQKFGVLRAPSLIFLCIVFRLPEHSGILRRLGKNMRTWKKQLFELRDHFLFYYNHRNSKLPTGESASLVIRFLIWINGTQESSSWMVASSR